MEHMGIQQNRGFSLTFADQKNRLLLVGVLPFHFSDYES